MFDAAGFPAHAGADRAIAQQRVEASALDVPAEAVRVEQEVVVAERVGAPRRRAAATRIETLRIERVLHAERR
ncbi:hypothetical protein, partial [Burkholderia stabilis]